MLALDACFDLMLCVDDDEGKRDPCPSPPAPDCGKVGELA